MTKVIDRILEAQGRERYKTPKDPSLYDNENGPVWEGATLTAEGFKTHTDEQIIETWNARAGRRWVKLQGHPSRKWADKMEGRRLVEIKRDGRLFYARLTLKAVTP